MVENLRRYLLVLGGDWWMKEGEGKNQSLLKEGGGDESCSKDIISRWIWDLFKPTLDLFFGV